jgi:hypothetical protein
MIPSVLSAQVRRGVEEFLLTTFPTTNPFFAGRLEELLRREGALFRGPYLSIKLPFLPGDPNRRLFPDIIPDGFQPHRHRQQAWERLDGRNPRSTLVATGTGSGKTEAFLFAILDDCLRRLGGPGIKAIIVYPMNALATDQARRLAKTIYDNPRLRGRVTAGLYIGGRQEENGTGLSRTMGPGEEGAACARCRVKPDQEAEAIRATLLADLPPEASDPTHPQHRLWLLAYLVDRHRREAKAQWWDYFRVRELGEEDLLDEPKALVGLEFAGRVEIVTRKDTGKPTGSVFDRYRYPSQEIDFGRKARLKLHDGSGFGEVDARDTGACTIDVKKGKARADLHPSVVFADDVVPTATVQRAVMRLA